MSTLLEIEEATRQLMAEERQRLMLWLITQLRVENQQPLPELRNFTLAEIQAWIKEDELDFQALKSQRRNAPLS